MKCFLGIALLAFMLAVTPALASEQRREKSGSENRARDAVTLKDKREPKRAGRLWRGVRWIALAPVGVVLRLLLDAY